VALCCLFIGVVYENNSKTIASKKVGAFNYRLMKKGEFPKQIKLSDRSSGWVFEEVEQWLENRINNRKEKTQ